MEKTFNFGQYDLSSFSGRLNAILDFSDEYLPIDKGRSRQLALEFGYSKGAARLWVLHNKQPTQKQLRTIIEASLLKVKTSTPVDAVLSWVVFGTETCPLIEEGDNLKLLPGYECLTNIVLSKQHAKIVKQWAQEAKERCGVEV